MFNKLVNRIDWHLTNHPFMRPHWWSRQWIEYINIDPPLTKENPLWKHSKAELKQIRLFNVSPEELGKEVESYLKKPLWKRWFIFGINKKINIWNYYRRCLRYKIVRDEIPAIEEDLKFSTEAQQLLDDAINYIYKQYLKFYDHARRKGEQSDYSEDCYSRYLSGDIISYLDKKITRLSIEEQVVLDKKLSMESHAIEAFMKSFYSRELFDATPYYKWTKESSPSPTNTPADLSPANKSSPTESNPLDHTKTWVKTKREELKNLLMDKESDQLSILNDFLEQSFDEIKAEIALYFKNYDFIIDNPASYKVAIEELGKLQSQIKKILRSVALLFHPDHVLSLTESKASLSLINTYGQRYNNQSSLYLEKLQNYQVRLQAWVELLKEDENAKILPKELDKIVQLMAELRQSVQEMDAELTAKNAVYLERKREKSKHLSELIQILQQYRMKFIEEDNQSLFVKSVKMLSKFQDRRKEWARMIQLCIERLEESTSKNDACFYSYQIVAYIVKNVRSVKQGFLGNLKFDDEYEKLGYRVLKKMGLYRREVFDCCSAQIALLRLSIQEWKGLSRGQCLMHTGEKELNEQAPIKQGSSDTELKNKFYELSEFFRLKRSSYRDGFEDSIHTTENSSNLSP